MSEVASIAQRILEDRGLLSRAFQQIADFFAAEPREFISRPMRTLADRIGVSEPTLIRFARHYGYQGLPDLRLACAMSLAAGDMAVSGHLEPRLVDKQVVNQQAKRSISLSAAKLVADDKSILLDSGSTVQLLAEQLVSMPALTIMTTSINTLLVLHNCEQHRLIMPGGTLRPGAMSLVGRLAENNLAEMTFDTAYIGADTIHPERGLSTYNEEEAHLNRAMIQACKRVVVLADASKFKGPALHHICDLSAVDGIISDTSLPTATADAIRATGTSLMLAEASASDNSFRG